MTRNGNEASGGRETGTDPRRGTEKTENDPQRARECQRPLGTTSALVAAAVFT